jgi:hypothetical protein
MGASDLPLGVCQRIEQRWSAQIKRLQAERDLKNKMAATPHRDDGAQSRLVEIADWTKPRDP